MREKTNSEEKLYSVDQKLLKLFLRTGDSVMTAKVEREREAFENACLPIYRDTFIPLSKAKMI